MGKFINTIEIRPSVEIITSLKNSLNDNVISNVTSWSKLRSYIKYNYYPEGPLTIGSNKKPIVLLECTRETEITRDPMTKIGKYLIGSAFMNDTFPIYSKPDYLFAKNINNYTNNYKRVDKAGDYSHMNTSGYYVQSKIPHQPIYSKNNIHVINYIIAVSFFELNLYPFSRISIYILDHPRISNDGGIKIRYIISDIDELCITNNYTYGYYDMEEDDSEIFYDVYGNKVRKFSTREITHNPSHPPHYYINAFAIILDKYNTNSNDDSEMKLKSVYISKLEII